METLFSFSPLVVAAIPIVLGLVEVIKQIGLPSKYAPLMSLLLGIFAVALTGETIQVVLAQGILVGLASCGLWSGSKATIQKPTE